MCTDVLMNDYVGRGKETFTYMYKECKHYSTGGFLLFDTLDFTSFPWVGSPCCCFL